MATQNNLDKLIGFFLILLDPILIVPRKYKNIIQQLEGKTASKLLLICGTLFGLILILAYFLLDQRKPHSDQWMLYRFCAAAFCLAIGLIAIIFKNNIKLLRFLPYVFSFGLMIAFCKFIHLPHGSRPSLIVYSATIILLLCSSSVSANIMCLALGTLVLRRHWMDLYETRFLISDILLSCVIFGAGAIFRNTWINSQILELKNADLQADLAKEKINFERNILTFIPPVIANKLNASRSRGGGHEEAMQEILELKQQWFSVLYSDLRNFSKRSSNIDFIKNDLIPKMGIIIDRVEQNSAVARLAGDAIFAFYLTDDPEEGFIRGVKDAVICTRELYLESINALKEPERYFILSWGKGVIGNVASISHKEISVFGDPANIGSRIDNLTKQEALKKKINNKPTVILSQEALDELASFSDKFIIETFLLKENDLSIRSYEDHSAIGLFECNDDNIIALNEVLSANNIPLIGV